LVLLRPPNLGMPAKASDVFSITIRPPADEMPERKDIETWLNSQGKFWICAWEKNSHYQIGIRTAKAVRSDNLRRSLCKALDATFTSVALVIKAHDDWEYLIGYCAKEAVEPDLTTAGAIDIDACTAKYKERRTLIDQLASQKISGIDAVVEKIVLECKKERKHSEKFIERMFGKVIHELPFTLFQRINKLRLYEFVKLKCESQEVEYHEVVPSTKAGTCNSLHREDVRSFETISWIPGEHPEVVTARPNNVLLETPEDMDKFLEELVRAP